MVYLKPAKLEQLILYLLHFNCAEVVLKLIFDCAKVELFQVNFRYTFKYFAFKDLYYSKIIQSSSTVTLKHILGLVLHLYLFI